MADLAQMQAAMREERTRAEAAEGRVAELEADLERAWATADACRKNALDWQQGRARLEAAIRSSLTVELPVDVEAELQRALKGQGAD